MALEIYETQETRSANVSNGRATATRRFRIFDDAAPLTTPNQIRELFGTTFGSTTLPDIGDEMVGDQTVFATGYSIRHVPESRGVWEVDFTYENTEPGQYQPQEVGYTEISIEYSAQLHDVWRANPSVPTNGTTTTASSTAPGNAGGTPIDSGGDPLSVLRRSSTVTITETVASATMEARSLAIRALRGRRNNSIFQGASIGQVLYLGASASRVALDKFQIVHRFEQDEWSHCRQIPMKGPDKQVILAPIDGILRAAVVNWAQPFPTFGDFNALSENF